MTQNTTLNEELVIPDRQPRYSYRRCPLVRCPWGTGYWQWLSVSLVVALLALLAWGLRSQASEPVEAGLAPDFSLTTFEGETITLSDLRGQVVVVNFWASWCPPCREEAAYLEATWRKYKDRGVVFIGVDYLDARPNALAYLEEFYITYPNGPDLGQKIADAYRIQGVPETFYIDKQGQLRGVKIGPLYPPALDDQIDALLAE